MRCLRLSLSPMLAYCARLQGALLQRKWSANFEYRSHVRPPAYVRHLVAFRRISGAETRPARPSDGTILAPARIPDLGLQRCPGPGKTRVSRTRLSCSFPKIR